MSKNRLLHRFLKNNNTEINKKDMSKIVDTIWQIEPHTEAKHAILRKYLDAWLPIITRWNGRVLYIDGFAGPGEYIGGKDGSPIIAIKSVLEHKAELKAEIMMLFIEADKARCENLNTIVDSKKIGPNIKPECICAKFADAIEELLDRLEEQKKRLAPAFVFIDPFGFTGIPFNLIKRIMGNEKCEVLITFMYEEINRFIGDEKLWEDLTATFGTDKWKEVITEDDPKKREFSLHGIYKKQLEEEANIKYVRSFKMTNKINKTDYFLFYGTNHIKGLTKMKAAMWKIDESGTFNFSDATYNPAQPMLFELTPNYYDLEKMIRKEFDKKTVSITELENYIITQTPYRETHYRKHVLRPMEKTQPSEIKVICGRKRKKGTFPPDCSIEFY
jgi:three-Cys-motif partner protein